MKSDVGEFLHDSRNGISVEFLVLPQRPQSDIIMTLIDIDLNLSFRIIFTMDYGNWPSLSDDPLLQIILVTLVMLGVVELIVQIENAIEEVALALQVQFVFGEGDFRFPRGHGIGT